MKNLPQAIIFDVDGTIADTERHGHLPACNDAFSELELPINWSWEEFKKMLDIPSNANRARIALTNQGELSKHNICLLYTSPSPRD